MTVLHKASIALAALAAIAIAAGPVDAADMGPFGQGSVKDGYVPLPRVMASPGAGPATSALMSAIHGRTRLHPGQ